MIRMTNRNRAKLLTILKKSNDLIAMIEQEEMKQSADCKRLRCAPAETAASEIEQSLGYYRKALEVAYANYADWMELHGIDTEL